MKKILILLTTLLSLNLFAGLVAPDVDTRVKVKAGYAFRGDDFKKSIAFGGDIVMKTNVYEADILNVYSGVKLNIADNIAVKISHLNNILSANLVGVVGLEEKYEDIKFYQQLGLGFGYVNIHNNIQGGFTNISTVSIVVPDVELGMIYDNFIIAIDMNLNLFFVNEPNKFTLPLAISLGYEF